MNGQEIIEMARQVGLCRTQSNFNDWIDAGPSGYELEAFAKLVAAKEREACAKAVEDLKDKSGVNEDGNAWITRITKGDCVKAIRASGEA
jgi:hypothetical protein